MILIVDDDRELCRSIQRLLKSYGFEAQCVHSANEAWEALGQQTPRVVLLDDHMPEKCWLELAREIKSHPSVADVPIVMFSAEADPDRVAKARELGVIDWIQKTRLYPDHLAARIGELYKAAS